VNYGHHPQRDCIERSKECVWNAIRDVGAIHKRLVPGFVIDCKLAGDWRTVTFANGMVVSELIVDVDYTTCRHSWSARGEPLAHHNASVQVFADGQEKSRVVWIADLMPNEVAGAIGEMIQQGLNAMKKTSKVALLMAKQATHPDIRCAVAAPLSMMRITQKQERLRL